MKLSTSIAVCAALFSFAGSAHAATVNLTGNDDFLGTVSIGQSGTIDNLVLVPTGSNSTEELQGAAFGALPADSEIIFSYTFLNGYGQNGTLESYATYNQTIGHRNYLAYSSSDGGDYSYYTRMNHPNDKIHAPSPILATANMNHRDTHGVTTITNVSDVDTNFGSFFVSYFQSIFGGRGAGDVVVHYEVEADPSAVPLPASLPLFGAGLLALTGLGLFKKTRRKNPSALR